MSFSADYRTAYELLRGGEPKKEWFSEEHWKEMRRQRILMTVLFPPKQPDPMLSHTINKPINLFPITVHRTTVQMKAPEQDD